MENNGEKFLDQKFSDLHKSEPIMHEQERLKEEQKNLVEEKKGEMTKEPAEKIADWLKIIERTHGHRDNPKKMEIIKEYYRNEYVIKPENIPESYYENQKRLAREQGHGNIEITPEAKKQLAEVITNDQKSTLDIWVNYFTSSDADAYPMRAKYWAFRSMLKFSSFDKEKKSFSARRKDTVAPFPDLNREALAYVIDIINKKANKENIPSQEGNPELEKLIQGENFGKLYAYAIEKVTPAETNELLTTEGEWIKYPQDSDHMPLVESLQGHGTGWCTAGESTAETQLNGGDFYVYYSKDKSGNPTIPRVAIRMEENQIGEVRGIAHEQNIDPYIGEIVDKKLSEFPDKEKCQKKTADMKLLTQIEKKQNGNEKLTSQELKFLYEFGSKIEGFGYEEDQRIQKIRKKRDREVDFSVIKTDIALIAGFPKEQLSITQEEALEGEFKFHYGNFQLGGLRSAKGIKLPETVIGDVDLWSLESAEELELPEEIGGDLNLGNLKSAKGLKLPKKIGGSLFLGNLQSTEGLELPKKIGGNFEHNIENYEENINLLENAKNKAIKMEIFKKEFMDDLSFIFVSDVQKEEDGLTNNQLMADEKLIPIDEKKLNSAKDVLLPTKNFVKNLYSFSEKVDNMHQSSRIWLENIDFKSLYSFDAVAVHEIAHTKSYKSITENNQLSKNNKKFRNLIEKIIRASNHLQKMKNIDFTKFDFSVNDWSELYALLYQREFLIKENPDNKKLVSKWDKHTFETANNLSNAIKNLNWEINKKIDSNLIYKDCHAFSFLLAREFENIFRDFDKMIKTLESCKKE